MAGLIERGLAPEGEKVFGVARIGAREDQLGHALGLALREGQPRQLQVVDLGDAVREEGGLNRGDIAGVERILCERQGVAISAPYGERFRKLWIALAPLFAGPFEDQCVGDGGRLRRDWAAQPGQAREGEGHHEHRDRVLEG